MKASLDLVTTMVITPLQNQRSTTITLKILEMNLETVEVEVVMEVVMEVAWKI